MKTTISALIIFLNILSMTSNAQTPITIPKEFMETPVPKPGARIILKYNNSNDECAVKILDNKLIVTQAEFIKQCQIKTDNGTLTGTDNGEWGGKLAFKPADTTQKETIIKQGNIKFIFRFNNNLYFIEGLAHLSFNEGALYELNNNNNQFSFKKILDFESAPQAFTIYKNQLLIAAYNSFFIVKDLKKKIPYKEVFWASLYPNSIAAFNDDNIFIGMRGGIVKLDLTNKTMAFYTRE